MRIIGRSPDDVAIIIYRKKRELYKVLRVLEGRYCLDLHMTPITLDVFSLTALI